MKTKTCTKCGQSFPETAEFFPPDRGKLRASCRQCQNRYYREHYRKNRDRRLQQFKEHYRNNKEQYLVYKRRYYEENKEQILDEQKAYYEENAESVKKRMREYRRKNPHYKLSIRRWKRNNKDLVNAYHQKRRALKRNLPATLTPEQWESIKACFDYSCAYCGETEESLMARGAGPLHQEHFIPLVKGGEYTHNNIIPACVSCNSSKNDKSFSEWYPEQLFCCPEREKRILSHTERAAEGGD